jgi:hypothetical protein
MAPILEDSSSTSGGLPIYIKPEANNLSNLFCSSVSSTTDEHVAEGDISWLDSVPVTKEHAILAQKTSLNKFLCKLYEQNIFAKPCRTATQVLQDLDPARDGFPEIVPQQGRWEYREPEFWTCGFFPGTLYALLERSIRYPASLGTDGAGLGSSVAMRNHLLPLCKSWSEPLHAMASRTDTHDIGFIVMPALKRDWELFGNERSLNSIVQAAHSLATRYIPKAGAIRSWDCLLKKDITVTDMENNLLVIIDSMCNLDLLFYAAAQTGNKELANIAAIHATTVLQTHLRPENVACLADDGYEGQLYSTCHVANISPQTGALKWRWTAQGYANDSTWARGQAWSILGYAQAYNWTKDGAFLETACGCAEYFLYRLQTTPSYVEVPGLGGKSRSGRLVPLWDFDAPIENPEQPLWDSSASVIAANGMLLLSQSLAALGRHSLSGRFLHAAIELVRDTLEVCLATEKAAFATQNDDNSAPTVQDVVVGQTFEAILKHGTANNNENARRRYSDHGLVYGDYYLIEFGNMLLSMGMA